MKPYIWTWFLASYFWVSCVSSTLNRRCPRILSWNGDTNHTSMLLPLHWLFSYERPIYKLEQLNCVNYALPSKFILKFEEIFIKSIFFCLRTSIGTYVWIIYGQILYFKFILKFEQIFIKSNLFCIRTLIGTYFWILYGHILYSFYMVFIDKYGISQ